MNRIKSLSCQSKKYFFFYALGLILCKEKRTTTGLAKIFTVTHDVIYRLLLRYTSISMICPRLMIKIAQSFSKQKAGWLIIDDTNVNKFHARWIEGLIDVFDTVLHRTNRGICLVVVVWSNGLVTIPISFKWWITKNLTDTYKKKSELATELIAYCATHNLPFQYIIADGLYCNKTMIDFCQARHIGFEMRIHSNRNVSIKGIAQPLKKHPYLKLMRNARTKTVSGHWHEHMFYFTAYKRKNKNGDFTVVFQVSNMHISDKDHVAIYEQRWEIEKMFRSMKQLLGISHCAARKIEYQTAHFYLVFFSYVFLQTLKIKLKLPNVETAAKYLQMLKLRTAINSITAFGENFKCFA